MPAFEEPENVSGPPAMNRASSRLSVDAIKLCVLMTPLAPTMIPFGLIRKTLPLACSVPYIEDGLPPVTRLSTADRAEGWMNCVSSPELIEKPCQLMMALLV